MLFVPCTSIPASKCLLRLSETEVCTPFKSHTEPTLGAIKTRNYAFLHASDLMDRHFVGSGWYVSSDVERQPSESHNGGKHHSTKLSNKKKFARDVIDDPQTTEWMKIMKSFILSVIRLSETERCEKDEAKKKVQSVVFVITRTLSTFSFTPQLRHQSQHNIPQYWEHPTKRLGTQEVNSVATDLEEEVS